MDRSKWRKLIKDVRWPGWVWVGECFFWYRPTRVVLDQRPSNCCVCVCVLLAVTMANSLLLVVLEQLSTSHAREEIKRTAASVVWMLNYYSASRISSPVASASGTSSVFSYSLSYWFKIYSFTWKFKKWVRSVFWRCWLAVTNSIRPVKVDWWGIGVVVCLEKGADCLHMVQLMRLSAQNPIVSSVIWIQTGFTFLVPG